MTLRRRHVFVLERLRIAVPQHRGIEMRVGPELHKSNPFAPRRRNAVTLLRCHTTEFWR
jgi:hypothetical protein